MNTRIYYSREISDSELVGVFNSRDYWLGATSDWDGGIFNPEREAEREAYYMRIVEKIQSLYPLNVLEAGCGVGYIVKMLNGLGIDTIGIDISRWAVEHAITPRIILGDILNLPFMGRQFDLIFSHDVLEHIPLSRLPKAFSELDRVARRNYHIISCGSLPDDRDTTHVTMHQLRWWRKRLPGSFKVEMKAHL